MDSRMARKVLGIFILLPLWVSSAFVTDLGRTFCAKALVADEPAPLLPVANLAVGADCCEEIEQLQRRTTIARLRSQSGRMLPPPTPAVIPDNPATALPMATLGTKTWWIQQNVPRNAIPILLYKQSFLI